MGADTQAGIDDSMLHDFLWGQRIEPRLISTSLWAKIVASAVGKLSRLDEFPGRETIAKICEEQHNIADGRSSTSVFLHRSGLKLPSAIPADTSFVYIASYGKGFLLDWKQLPRETPLPKTAGARFEWYREAAILPIYSTLFVLSEDAKLHELKVEWVVAAVRWETDMRAEPRSFNYEAGASFLREITLEDLEEILTEEGLAHKNPARCPMDILKRIQHVSSEVSTKMQHRADVTKGTADKIKQLLDRIDR